MAWWLHRVSCCRWNDPSAAGIRGDLSDPAFRHGQPNSLNKAFAGKAENGPVDSGFATEVVGIQSARCFSFLSAVAVRKWKGWICVNKYLKLLLKTASCLVDQSVAQVDRASDRVSELVDRGKEVIHPEDHRLRNALSFAAGVGLGVGAAILCAPASGKETRSSITQQMQQIRERASYPTERVG